MKREEPAPNRETALIEALSRKFGPPPPGVVLGIGDDCAALSLDGADYLLWTVDTLVEGVHFDLSYTTLAQLGWKALAVNLSDIAAMGGEPGQALLSLGWPPERDPAWPWSWPTAWPRPPGSTTRPSSAATRWPPRGG